MSMTTRKTDFETSDLSLAAFLVSRGHALLRVEGQGRKTFSFPVEAREQAEKFYQGATVPARAFANALKDLKALIREI
jgi:hypothetical protein